jgi:hypothetical protein
MAEYALTQIFFYKTASSFIMPFYLIFVIFRDKNYTQSDTDQFV